MTMMTDQTEVTLRRLASQGARAIEVMSEENRVLDEGLLRKTWETIQDQHEFHNQASWLSLSDEMLASSEFRDAFHGGKELKLTPGVCGTQACFAGWAVHLAGWDMVGATSGAILAIDPQSKTAFTVQTAAQYVLGLSWDEAETLFDGHNTRHTLGCLVEELLTNAEVTRA
jgi:hypothetical protein